MPLTPETCPSLEELLGELPVGLLITDARGTILKVNGTMCTWSGYAALQLVGQKKLQDLFTVGGRIFHQTHWMPILQMQRSISEVKFELRRSDGRLVTVMMNAIRKDAAGDAYDVVSIIVAEERNKYERQLLLERKRSDELADREVRAQEVLQAAESQLRQAVRVGGLHLWSADEEGNRHFEPSIAELLELDDVASLNERDFLEAILPQDREAEEQAFKAALADPAAIKNWTFGVRDAKGNRKVLLASGQTVPSSSDEKRRFVGVLKDVTELAKKAAEAEDRALFAEQMVGIVSHDLRNPLSAVTMGAAVLGRDAMLGDKHRRVLDNINRSLKRARGLIDELLDFTLVRVGHGLTVTRRPASFHEVIHQYVEELKLAFPSNPIHHVAQGHGKCILDPDRVAQLLGNLVANAVTYGEPGGPITVTSTGDDDGCRLEVHNLGEPVPEAMAERIFEPMVRGGTTDHSVRSVGLGLFIVKAIAQAHDGAVSVRSSREEGTTFTFVLGQAETAARCGAESE